MYKLYNGDCLEIMDRLIEEGVKVDMILTDIPYGTTNNKWDSVIPFDKMWERINKIINSNTAVLLFAQTPFDKALGFSNIKKLKYEWIWEKSQSTGFLNAKKMPLKSSENILVFYDKLPTYNPQMRKGFKPYKCVQGRHSSNYGAYNEGHISISNGERYPINIIKFDKESGHHPTQKPVALLEYLIKTYTNENELVLDFTMGSGSTGVACMNANRKFIGIELDNNYFDIASKRIEEAFFNAQNKEGAINEE